MRPATAGLGRATQLPRGNPAAPTTSARSARKNVLVVGPDDGICATAGARLRHPAAPCCPQPAAKPAAPRLPLRVKRGGAAASALRFAAPLRHLEIARCRTFGPVLVGPCPHLDDLHLVPAPSLTADLDEHAGLDPDLEQRRDFLPVLAGVELERLGDWFADPVLGLAVGPPGSAFADLFLRRPQVVHGDAFERVRPGPSRCHADLVAV